MKGLARDNRAGPFIFQAGLGGVARWDRRPGGDLLFSFDKGGDRLANLSGRVLLDEMNASDCDLLLVGP